MMRDCVRPLLRSEFDSVSVSSGSAVPLRSHRMPPIDSEIVVTVGRDARPTAVPVTPFLGTVGESQVPKYSRHRSTAARRCSFSKAVAHCLRRWSVIRRRRMSAVRSGELELPTHHRHSLPWLDVREAVARLARTGFAISTGQLNGRDAQQLLAGPLSDVMGTLKSDRS